MARDCSTCYWCHTRNALVDELTNDTTTYYSCYRDKLPHREVIRERIMTASCCESYRYESRRLNKTHTQHK